MLGDGRQLRIEREVDDFAIAQRRHLDEHRLLGVEHRRALRQDEVDLRAQDVEYVFGRFDVVVSGVASDVHIGDDADLAASKKVLKAMESRRLPY